MKCKSCAGNYKTKELVCPYCGHANLLGRFWFAKKSEAELEYERAEADYKKRVTPFVLNRFVNRLIAIFSLVLLLFVGGMLVWCGVRLFNYVAYENGVSLGVNRKLESIYKTGDMRKLYNYMSERDLISKSNYRYSQAAMLGNDYTNYQIERLKFLRELEENPEEACERLGMLLCDAFEVYGVQLGIYSEPDPDNERLIESYREEIHAFLYGTLGLTKEEYLSYTEDEFLISPDVEELVELIKERRAWDE